MGCGVNNAGTSLIFAFRSDVRAVNLFAMSGVLHVITCASMYNCRLKGLWAYERTYVGYYRSTCIGSSEENFLFQISLSEAFVVGLDPLDQSHFIALPMSLSLEGSLTASLRSQMPL